jgi:hypothetical protein
MLCMVTFRCDIGELRVVGYLDGRCGSTRSVAPRRGHRLRGQVHLSIGLRTAEVRSTCCSWPSRLVGSNGVISFGRKSAGQIECLLVQMLMSGRRQCGLRPLVGCEPTAHRFSAGGGLRGAYYTV